MTATVKVGDRVRWRGLTGHEGTVLSVVEGDYAWVMYDDGGEKDAYLCDLVVFNS